MLYKIATDEELEQYLSPRGNIKRSISPEQKTAVFVYRASKLHANRYLYTNTEYINNSTKVAIDCLVHGVFYQTPAMHLSGRGCPSCANKDVTTEEFIEKAKVVHGTKYDYSKVVYVASKEKVVIVCKTHGSWEQIPNSHLSGYGCPKCGNSHYDTLYLWNFCGTSMYKIGVTAGDPTTRINRVASIHKARPKVILTIKTEHALSLETKVKHWLLDRFPRPLSNIEGYTEIFDIPESSIESVLTFIGGGSNA